VIGGCSKAINNFKR
jgi:hypothetical protein